MDKNRINRVNDQIMREVSGLIRSLKDSRIPILTSVIAVDTTGDLKQSKIYVSVMGSEEEKSVAFDALKAASGHIRRQLGERIRLHYTPEIIFVVDNSIERGAHINSILHDIIKDEDLENG